MNEITVWIDVTHGDADRAARIHRCFMRRGETRVDFKISYEDSRSEERIRAILREASARLELLEAVRAGEFMPA